MRALLLPMLPARGLTSAQGVDTRPHIAKVFVDNQDARMTNLDDSRRKANNAMSMTLHPCQRLMKEDFFALGACSHSHISAGLAFRLPTNTPPPNISLAKKRGGRSQ